MSTINVEVNGNRYTLACADGDEDRLRSLASYVDTRARDLEKKLGHVNENKLLLMTAILIADELQDSIASGGNLADQLSPGDVAYILNGVADQVDALSGGLAKA